MASQGCPLLAYSLAEKFVVSLLQRIAGFIIPTRRSTSQHGYYLRKFMQDDSHWGRSFVASVIHRNLNPAMIIWDLSDRAVASRVVQL